MTPIQQALDYLWRAQVDWRQGFKGECSKNLDAAVDILRSIRPATDEEISNTYDNDPDAEAIKGFVAYVTGFRAAEKFRGIGE